MYDALPFLLKTEREGRIALHAWGRWLCLSILLFDQRAFDNTFSG